jgi:RimJ/RimL family protein N-acetyltransferase
MITAETNGVPGSITGHWVTLEPLSPSHAAELQELETRRQMIPAMGGPFHNPSVDSRYLPSMAVRDNTSGRLIGLLETGEMMGYPGVAVVLIYVEPSLARPGVAMEACGIYMPMVFDNGAAILHVEVLSFNRDMIRIFEKRRQYPQVRLRRHIYVAGEFWDLLMYGFDRKQFEDLYGKFKRVLPGGQRPISALGSSRT